MVSSPTIFIVRHAERLDHVDRNWQPDPSRCIWDPPITSKGHQQAQKTGMELARLIKQQNLDTTKITIYSSPFQRCIDTSLSMIEGMALSATLRLEVGLGEWMSDRFFDDVCPAQMLINQQYEQIARLQAYNYSAQNNSLLLKMDYAYQSVQSEFDFPERYTDMLQRFDETRFHCLQEHQDGVIIFVTHAAGANALLDGFRNKLTRPLESNYCSISCVKYKYEECMDLSDQSDEELYFGYDNNNNNVSSSSASSKWSIELEMSDTHL
ncbi:phosphoglycerate mutase-like protein [Backusella circina FSU 941]|nr:phosphoglycerate mutase-like protein [Backusella circina FSU 941]